MADEIKLYGVSTGDGNNGISHTFADYYVRTNDPWRLVQLAMLTQFKPEWQAQCRDEMMLEGEAEYTIQACLLEPLDREEPEEGDEYSSYSESNGAWMLVDVFPEDEPHDGVMQFDSIEDAFGDDAELVANQLL